MLLRESGLFDPSWYSKQVDEKEHRDPITHYLDTGWLAGFEPNESFPGSALRPCFFWLGFDEPPAITFLTLQSAGWKIPGTRAELEAITGRVRATGLFDASFYVAQAGGRLHGVDPAIHYVAVGEWLGLAPSERFDSGYYRTRYPDVAKAGMVSVLHYSEYGRFEGRVSRLRERHSIGGTAYDPAKENIILTVHEASRTGAPILGWNIARHLTDRYNIYTVCLGEGDLSEAFRQLSVEIHGPFSGAARCEEELELGLREMLATLKFRYAIVNSVESRAVVPVLARRFVPTLLLVHEFASYTSPVASLTSAMDWASELIFPANVVSAAAHIVHPVLKTRLTHILPQGRSSLPPVNNGLHEESAIRAKRTSHLETLRQMRDTEDVFIVLGAGTVHIRKGVDLFLSAAAKVMRSDRKRRIHFVWIGEGYRPRDDMNYSVYLHEQVRRSGLAEHVTFVEPLEDLEPVYSLADAFLLASRLDPLPNVSIDAALHGIPIICFREGSGTAEILLDDADTALGVVDYGDADAVSQVILELAHNAGVYARIADATRNLARERFDMPSYVSHLDRIAGKAASKTKQRSADAATLLADSTFDQDMFLGTSEVIESRGSSIARYLALAAARGWDTPPVPDTTLRRPAPGFNPRVYATYNAARLIGGVDPLADYIRRGKVSGPWQMRVLRPDESAIESTVPIKLRSVLHVHIFYPDLAADLLARLERNHRECDLLVSTSNSEKAREIERFLAPYSRGNLQVRVVPNRGRDIGPLLTEFAADVAGYELVGHLHAKRSLFDGEGAMGNAWRDFLWRNLLGAPYAMMDQIVSEFERDDKLGLVFASDPHLVGWDGNREHAASLAARMGWKNSLPEHFDFPLGTMFWMRRAALQPLLDLNLTWGDYPDEPLPYDGTILHALERLTPFASQLTGLSAAVTHVPGVSW